MNHFAEQISEPMHDPEVEAMTLVMQRKFGSQALDIASDFAAEHRVIGDHARARKWDTVCAELARGQTCS